MNIELKKMMRCAFLALAVVIIGINAFGFYSHNFIVQATFVSQRMALNRLRRPNLRHSSEWGKYPLINPKQNYQLVAVRHTNRLYVICHHKAIYVANAKVNLPPTTTHVNRARGERTFHVHHNNQIIAENWVSFDKLGYLEAPMMVNGKHSRANWFKNRAHFPNTIEVSSQDAHWLQQIPKETTLTVK